jgi:hypothetical protein
MRRLGPADKEKREYLSILIIFLLLHGFEQQLIEYKISNDRRAKTNGLGKNRRKKVICVCVLLFIQETYRS